MAIKYLMQLDEDQIELLSSMHNVQERNHNWFSIDMEWKTLKQRGWSITKAKKIARSLYGIIGLYTGEQKIVDYFVTPELYDPVQGALGNGGIFEREFEGEDVEILRAIYKRDQQLRIQYRKQFSPRFHETEVANLSERHKEGVVDSLDKLTGLLAVTYIRDDFSPSGGNYIVYFAKRRWFLPTARIPDAEKILNL